MVLLNPFGVYRLRSTEVLQVLLRLLSNFSVESERLTIFIEGPREPERAACMIFLIKL